TVEIAIRVMNAVKPPEKRRPVIELVPEVYGVVEQQEPKDDAQRFRHAEPLQETESVPLGQRLHRFDNRQLTGSRVSRCRHPDGGVASQALRSGLALPPRRPRALDPDEGAPRHAPEKPAQLHVDLQLYSADPCGSTTMNPSRAASVCRPWSPPSRS